LRAIFDRNPAFSGPEFNRKSKLFNQHAQNEALTQNDPRDTPLQRCLQVVESTRHPNPHV
jgi:hypothetical protein